MGELAWHGSAVLLRLMLLVLISSTGLVIGEVARGLRETRACWRAGAEVQDLVLAIEARTEHDTLMQLPAQRRRPVPGEDTSHAPGQSCNLLSTTDTCLPEIIH